MKPIYLSIIALFIIFVSCEKDVDIELPAVKPQLVVFGVVSPEDTATRIQVRKSKPYFGHNSEDYFNVIEDALVKITHNKREYILPFDEASSTYRVDSSVLRIVPGAKYSLEVEVDNFPIATSTITIQKNVNRTLDLVSISENDQDMTEFKVKWHDNEQEKNYYRLTGYYELVENTNEYYSGGILDNDEMYLFDDVNWNGEWKESNGLRTNESATKTVYLKLLTVDYHYYQYHKTVWLQYDQGVSPFSEPTLIYSNIENGLGVFCSYRDYTLPKNWEIVD